MPKSKTPKIDMPTRKMSVEAMLGKFDIEAGPSFDWLGSGVKGTTFMKDVPMWAAETWDIEGTLRVRINQWRNRSKAGLVHITVDDCSGQAADLKAARKARAAA